MSKTKQKVPAKIILCDSNRCLGCRSCEVACALEHSESKDLREAVLEKPGPQSRVTVEAAGDHGLPLQCRHCEDAPCVAVCPTEAIHRMSDGGPVLIDEERCIGCRMCLIACPFGVISTSRDGGAVVKCDLCIERQEAGQEPACVTACPTQAIRFVDIEEAQRQKRRAAVAETVAAEEAKGQAD
jgi:carbon-monoxide dehydrogenase iron sulfur subunit